MRLEVSSMSRKKYGERGTEMVIGESSMLGGKMYVKDWWRPWGDGVTREVKSVTSVEEAPPLAMAHMRALEGGTGIGGRSWGQGPDRDVDEP